MSNLMPVNGAQLYKGYQRGIYNFAHVVWSLMYRQCEHGAILDVSQEGDVHNGDTTITVTCQKDSGTYEPGKEAQPTTKHNIKDVHCTSL